MLLLTTAMKPLSACTTPRRLMVPISRHFLPVLHPEPTACITTGLRKGPRRPLAPYSLSGARLASFPALSPSPLPAAAASAGGLVFGTGAAAVAFACALCLAATTATRFAAPPLFTPTEPVPAARAFADEEDFTGAVAATPLGLVAACFDFAAAAADG